MTKPKTYTAAFNARAVLELLREQKPLAQVAAQYEVRPSHLLPFARMPSSLSEYGPKDRYEYEQ